MEKKDKKKVSLEPVAQYYIRGADTYQLKDALKSAGCTWDQKMSAWITPFITPEEADQVRKLGLTAHLVANHKDYFKEFEDAEATEEQESFQKELDQL